MTASTKIHINLSKKKMALKYTTIFSLFVFAITLFSCNKEDDSYLGNNFISDLEKLNLDSTNIPIKLSSNKTDSVINSYYYIPIGFLNDNVFGYSKASAVFQFKPDKYNISFTDIDSIVSLKIYIHTVSRYGDSTQNYKVDIYKLNSDLDDTIFYTNKIIPESSLSLINSDCEIKTDTSGCFLIELPKSFAESMSINADSLNYINEEEFMKFFKGFYVTPSASNSGTGCVHSLSFLGTDTRMELVYYSKETKNTLRFSYGGETIVASMIEHDYSTASSDVQNAIANPNFNEYSFIQGLGGINTKISISPLDSIFTNDKVVINRALLKLNIRNFSDITAFPAPPQLYLVKYNSSNELNLIRDMLTGSLDVYSGKYNSTEQCYYFNITAEIQSMILNNDNYNLYLIPSQDRNAGFPHRVCLWGDSNNDKQAKLEVFYSYK